MICLKNRTFAVSQTAHLFDTKVNIPLWFAWKIVLLQYHKQQHLEQSRRRLSCDLLEKSYFCSITNSCARLLVHCVRVVICLKNRTFAVSQTAYFTSNKSQLLLWFAWKIVLLQYHKQLPLRGRRGRLRCDLLEKSYFCSITNSWQFPQCRFLGVVICLKNRTFAVSQTASSSHARIHVCCDLLEKSYFCSITNSGNVYNATAKHVVICLKNRTFAVSQTAGQKPNRSKA